MTETRTSTNTAEDSAARAIYRRLFSDWIAGYKKQIALIFLLMVIVAISGGVYPALISHIFDRLDGATDPAFYSPFLGDNLVVIPALIIITASIKAVAMYFQVLNVNALALKLTTALQKQMMAHLIEADLSHHAHEPSGNLISRIMNDLNLVREAVVRLANNLVRDMLTALVMIGVMFWFSWLLSLLVLAVYPLAMRPIILIGNRQRKASASLQVHMGKVTSLLAESLQGIRMIKAYQLEDAEKKRSARAFDTLYDQLVGLLAGRARVDPILEALGGVAIAGVIGVASWQVASGQMKTSDVIGFITALVMLVPPVRAIGTLNAVSQEGAAALERIFGLLDRQNDITDKPDAHPFSPAHAEISFKDVSFHYGDKAILSQIDFTVKAGQTVALVGPSGGGKSTILNLIPRFFDVDGGRVAIDGVDVRDIPMGDLRGAIALVAQDAVLFDDTIAANIGYGRANSTQQDIKTAAKTAAADEFISELPEGFNTQVGERGGRLSGGQKQRIAIARAMVRNAPILLLDEATSALDAHAEGLVQQAIDRLSEGKTTIIIAHRLASIMHADRILVIDDGRIVEQGRHAELLAAGGLYAQLCALQNISG